MKAVHRKHLSSFQIIILGFAGVILLGAALLMLPVSAKDGETTSAVNALFTSVSAVCVTGLVTYDTAVHWSMFGKCVILTLIQIGGLGVVTVAAAITIVSGKKISLMQRSTMQAAISASHVGGIVRLTGFILKIVFITELTGAVIMSPVFCRDFGFFKGIAMSLFHSVSAFCNAGFDVMGERGQFSSLTSYSPHPLINIVIMLLIVIGGISFLTLADVNQHGLKLKKYSMQSKIILSTTLVLILLPALYFYFMEFNELPAGERVLNSLFQSVTTRTAGFNTADLSAMSSGGQFIMIILMLIGGSPGSTAGGMKTTTAAVLVFAAVSVFRRKDDVECFGRRISEETVKSASALLLMYIGLFAAGGLIISAIEGLALKECLFEAASAVGTVGLTLGITPQLGTVSKIILMALMYFGRVGGLTLIFAATSEKTYTAKLPQESVTVG